MEKSKFFSLSVYDKAKLLIGKNWWQNEDYDGLLPHFVLSDGPVGLRHPLDLNVWGGEIAPSIAYPSIQILANTWNKKLSYQMGKALGNDCVEQNIDILLAPGVNIKRIPQCGRNFEYFSEDPLLSGSLAREYIRGVQSQHVGACLKHFACNSTEINRKYVSSNIDEETLRNIYTKQFEIALKAKPWAVMTSYNKINGIDASFNNKLFSILRNDFKYKGMIMSDWEACRDATRAINAGMNFIMPYSEENFNNIMLGVKLGKITEETIDLSAKYVINTLEKIEKEKEKRKINLSPIQRQKIADNIAEEGMVLLKNNGILPLKNKTNVNVLGEPAFKYYSGGGSSQVNPIGNFLRLDSELKESGILVDQNSHISIITVGDDCNTEREELNRESIKLSKDQEDLIVNESKSKKVIVVLYVGACIDMTNWVDKVDAILLAGYSGVNSNRIVAKILTGKTNPSGRLSETFAKQIGDYPGNNTKDDFDNTNYIEKSDVGYRYFCKNTSKILYPFGYGLNYSNTLINCKFIDKKLYIRIENPSKFSSKETIQIYVLRKGIMELIAFNKYFVKAHKEANYIIDLKKLNLNGATKLFVGLNCIQILTSLDLYC